MQCFITSGLAAVVADERVYNVSACSFDAVVKVHNLICHVYTVEEFDFNADTKLI